MNRASRLPGHVLPVLAIALFLRQMIRRMEWSRFVRILARRAKMVDSRSSLSCLDSLHGPDLDRFGGRPADSIEIKDVKFVSGHVRDLGDIQLKTTPGSPVSELESKSQRCGGLQQKVDTPRLTPPGHCRNTIRDKDLNLVPTLGVGTPGGRSRVRVPAPTTQSVEDGIPTGTVGTSMGTYAVVFSEECQKVPFTGNQYTLASSEKVVRRPPRRDGIMEGGRF